MVRAQAIERARAARVLLAAQQPAEGIRLALEALAALEPELPNEASTEARGIAIDARSPRLDRDVARADVDRAERALRLIEELDGEVRSNGQRRAWMALGVGIVIAALVLALRPSPAIEVTASASYDAIPDHGPGAVLDGNVETNWLMPDRTPGWLDLRFAAPREVSGLVIRNGTNAPYQDRAVERMEVVIFDEAGAMLASTEQRLSLGEEVSIEVEASNASRVRIYVRSWHRAGGALDEVQILP
jgi:hypothetical protein